MNDLNIKLDTSGNIEYPEMVLCYRNGTIVKNLTDIHDLHHLNELKSAKQFTFTVYKNNCDIWDRIKDNRVIWIPEENDLYVIKVNLSENTSSSKSITATHLTEDELGRLKLYNTEINTEDEIELDEDFEPSVLHNPNNPKRSVINRITEKCSNLIILHVDKSIANIQRVFSWNDTSIYNAIQDIEEDINCHFEFGCYRDEETGQIIKTISVYDKESSCNECGYRGEVQDVCPECNSTDISTGFGEDTTAFLSIDNFINDNSYSTNIDDISNCFRIEAGDEDMTAVLQQCNPNGSPYIWIISDFFKEDMSDALVQKLDEYDELYVKWTNDEIIDIDVSEYNELIRKYQLKNEDLQLLPDETKGYSNLMLDFYEVIDFEWYLSSILIPTIKSSISSTTAQEQVELLLPDLTGKSPLSPVAVSNFNVVSVATASSAVSAMAKVILDSRYKITVANGATFSVTDEDNQIGIWNGSLIITNYSDEDDTATSPLLSVVVNGDYETFVKQKIDKLLNKGDTTDYGISSLFKLPFDDFKKELTNYGLTPLNSLKDSCQGCIDILIEQGVADPDSWQNNNGLLYDSLYTPWRNKLSAIEEEIKVRENEVDFVSEFKSKIIKIRDSIQEQLNFEDFVTTKIVDGETIKDHTLWNELQLFRRDGTYSNQNYISDGLSNAELFKNAKDFYNDLEKDLKKQTEIQHIISSTLKHLISISGCEELKNKLKLGNWLRLELDNTIYKLRLIGYDFSYDNTEDDINVVFSNGEIVRDSISEVSDVISNVKNIISSYSSTKKKAESGSESKEFIDGWTTNGLDATLTKIMNNAENQNMVYDSHGLIMRKYDDVSDTYDDVQTKLVNSTLAFTTDAWKTVKTAIGQFYYVDPDSGKLLLANGINGELILGKLLLGENLLITNDDGSLRFDRNGLEVKVKLDDDTDQLLKLGKNGFQIKDAKQITIESGNIQIKDGNVKITGDIIATNITATSKGKIGCWNITENSMYDNTGAQYTGVNKSGYGMAFWAGGTNLNGNNAPFRVSHDGKLVATDATITGNITTTYATLNNAVVKEALNMTSKEDEITFPVLRSLKNEGSLQLIVGSNNMLDELIIQSNAKCYIEALHIGILAEDIEISLIGSSILTIDGNTKITGELGLRGGYNNTSTGTANARFCNIPSNDTFSRLARTTSSSKRYKNIINTLSNEDIHKLYDIPTYWFTYRDDYLSSDDERYQRQIPGFIVEDWESIMPIAIDHNCDGSPEMWNSNIVVPLMFEMIKNEHKKNIELEKRIKKLERG